MNFKKRGRYHFLIEVCFLILLLLLLFLVINTAFAEEPFTPVQEQAILKKLNAQLPKLPTVLVYNSEFARRLGLNPKKAIQLDPGLYAVAFVVRRRSDLTDYNPDGIPDFWWNHMKLNVDETQTMMDESKDEQNAYSILLQQLFPNEPREDGYECFLNLYLNESEPKVQKIAWGKPDLWWNWKNDPFSAYDPIFSEFHWYVNTNKKLSDPNLYKVFGKDTDNHQVAMIFGSLNNFGRYPRFDVAKSLKVTDKEPDDPFDMEAKGYYKHFLPNIIFTQFSVDCDLFSKYADNHGTSIWYEQKGLKMRKINGLLNEKHLVRLRIPPEITNSTTFKSTYTGNTFGTFITGGKS